MNARPPATSEAAVLARGPVAIGVAPNGARKGKADWPWTVCAFGPAEAACVTAAALAGGHVRVGFENNLHEPDGRVAPDNAALVRRAVNRIRACGLALADVHEARRLLGMQPVASPIIPVVGTLAS